jgi:5-methylcytosine-specific restriction endonuclease McrA
MSTYMDEMSYKYAKWFKSEKRRFKRGKPCKECNQKKSPENMTVDHIVPVYQGADPMDKSNWQVLCIDCHHAKTRREYGEKERKDGAV